MDVCEVATRRYLSDDQFRLDVDAAVAEIERSAPPGGLLNFDDRALAMLAASVVLIVVGR